VRQRLRVDVATGHVADHVYARGGGGRGDLGR